MRFSVTAKEYGRAWALFFLLLIPGFALAQEDPPRSVQALWDGVDPARESLDIRLVRRWEEEGLVLSYLTFHIGTFKGRASRLAAFYGYPKDNEQLPGLLHLHGGGQRAFLHEVRYYARRGYACLSINWGGREMEGAMAGDPNTDWGAVDPTQKNVPGYSNLLPGEKYLDKFQSPRNNNWYLLTIAGRRGLTFLERQPVVDRERLGVYGHSMGGNLTVYVAGTDDRVRVAAPSVGGQGFRTINWELLPGQRRKVPNGDMKLYRATLGFQSYAPRIRAPLLWLSSTNDFHGIMDDTYRTGALIPHGAVRYSFAPHLNHRFTPEFAVTRPLWLDQHLKKGMSLPEMPAASLLLEGVPEFRVTPVQSHPVARVEIMYSVDPDPRARFWRTANSSRQGGTWTAALPVLSVNQPLFAFANIYYRLPKPVEVQFARPTSTFAISSLMKTASPTELKSRGVKATDKPLRLIDDFSSGFQDWYLLSADNPHHWQFWTRKITDPKWRGGEGEHLALEVRTEKPNELVLVITENFFRGYRGRRKGDSVAVVKLPGGEGWHQVSLRPGDFMHQQKRTPLESWEFSDLLGFRAYYGERSGKVLGSTRWAGGRPEFRNLRWVKPGKDG